jgi:hypothetical protein
MGSIWADHLRLLCFLMIRVFHIYFPGRTLLLALSEASVVVLAALPAAYAVFGTDALNSSSMGAR